MCSVMIEIIPNFMCVNFNFINKGGVRCHKLLIMNNNELIMTFLLVWGDVFPDKIIELEWSGVNSKKLN